MVEFVDALDREGWAELGVEIDGDQLGAPAYLKDYARGNGYSVAREYVGEAESGRVDLSPRAAVGSQSPQRQFEDGSVYRQNRPTQLDKIKNLRVEVHACDVI